MIAILWLQTPELPPCPSFLPDILPDMADEFAEEQRQLGQIWKKARKDGCMSPWQQARVFGLNEAWQEMYGDTTYGKAKWISERVYVQGPGRKHPSTPAIKQLVDKMTADDDWFPGKVYGSLGGRPSVVTETNKSIMATSAMAMKERGIEPTYALIIAQCPNASLNPSTGEPVSKQVVYDILNNRCYDIDPSMPWSHQKRLAKVAVLPQDIPKRLAFGKHMLSLKRSTLERTSFCLVSSDLLRPCFLWRFSCGRAESAIRCAQSRYMRER